MPCLFLLSLVLLSALCLAHERGNVKKRTDVMDDFEFRSTESRARETTFIPLRACEVHAFTRFFGTSEPGTA